MLLKLLNIVNGCGRQNAQPVPSVCLRRTPQGSQITPNVLRILMEHVDRERRPQGSCSSCPSVHELKPWEKSLSENNGPSCAQRPRTAVHMLVLSGWQQGGPAKQTRCVLKFAH